MQVLIRRNGKLVFLTIVWLAVFLLALLLSLLLDLAEQTLPLNLVVRTGVSTAIIVLALNLFLVPRLRALLGEG
ncbi:hypothetical protein OTERR_10740 [Oryzomicrobium terrae]|uniref:Uncharacterized protein n=1 Tax=Oryzomicrobium terrae TaxID=1735038 RepID=A0A5C1E6M6_9RHOO|nr:hypothetical protein [Oryzomicrobium terrae]QEL64550.1 hypothetical protein OTERR_10740 [Oryzomicrobium terrae]